MPNAFCHIDLQKDLGTASRKRRRQKAHLAPEDAALLNLKVRPFTSTRHWQNWAFLPVIACCSTSNVSSPPRSSATSCRLHHLCAPCALFRWTTSRRPGWTTPACCSSTRAPLRRSCWSTTGRTCGRSCRRPCTATALAPDLLQRSVTRTCIAAIAAVMLALTAQAVRVNSFVGV